MDHDATNRPLSLLPKPFLFVGGYLLPPRQKRLTPNGMRAYGPPDVHIVDRITPDKSNHHKSRRYVSWEGGAIKLLSHLPNHVQIWS